jgi:putative serine protease PepD
MSDFDERGYPPAPTSAPISAPPVRRRGGGEHPAAASVVGAIVGAALFGGGFFLAQRLQGVGTPTVAPAVKVTTVKSIVATDALEAAAAKVLPTVVNVNVTYRRGTGVGSGVIVRSDGYILTNNHVIDGAVRVTVRLGTEEVTATVVGTDPTTDIAVIRVGRTGLPAATIGDSSGLRIGQTVIAVGSPFGLDKTVTAGIVSALHRSDLTSDSSGMAIYTNLIQTDAPINPGNSGGALADLTGSVVGMNTLIQSPSGTLGAAQSAGIGFAIPVGFAMPIADLLIAGRKVTHPYLGANYVTLPAAYARYYGLPTSSGAVVQDVTADSPAAKAGMQPDDIIVGFGGQAIESAEQVFLAVQTAQVGVGIPVRVWRGSETTTLTVTLVTQ